MVEEEYCRPTSGTSREPVRDKVLSHTEVVILVAETSYNIRCLKINLGTWDEGSKVVRLTSPIGEDFVPFQTGYDSTTSNQRVTTPDTFNDSIRGVWRANANSAHLRDAATTRGNSYRVRLYNGNPMIHGRLGTSEMSLSNDSILK